MRGLAEPNIPYLVLRDFDSQHLLRQVHPSVRAALPHIARADTPVRVRLAALSNGLFPVGRDPDEPTALA